MDYYRNRTGLYLWKEEYTSQVTRNLGRKYYKKITTQEMWDIQDSKGC